MSEQQNTEYKFIWDDKFLKWICGFANAQGGRIFIGKEDDGTVVGLKNSKRLLEDLPNKIATILGIVYDVNMRYGKNKETMGKRRELNYCGKRGCGGWRKNSWPYSDRRKYNDGG